jgi:hypothetical protein
LKFVVSVVAPVRFYVTVETAEMPVRADPLPKKPDAVTDDFPSTSDVNVFDDV